MCERRAAASLCGDLVATAWRWCRRPRGCASPAEPASPDHHGGPPTADKAMTSGHLPLVFHSQAVGQRKGLTRPGRRLPISRPDGQVLLAGSGGQLATATGTWLIGFNRGGQIPGLVTPCNGPGRTSGTVAYPTISWLVDGARGGPGARSERVLP